MLHRAYTSDANLASPAAQERDDDMTNPGGQFGCWYTALLFVPVCCLMLAAPVLAARRAIARSFVVASRH